MSGPPPYQYGQQPHQQQPFANSYYGGEHNDNIPTAQLVDNQQQYGNQRYAQQQQQQNYYNQQNGGAGHQYQPGPPPPQQYQMGGSQPQPQRAPNGSGQQYQQPSGSYAKGGPVPYQQDAGFDDGRGGTTKVGSCRDSIFALLFIAHLAVYLGIGLWYYGKYVGNVSAAASANTTATPVNLSDGGWGLLAIAGGTGLVVALIILFLVRKYARPLIWMALIFSVISTAALAIYFLGIGQYTTGIILIILAALNAVWIYFIRNRIQLTAVMVETISVVLTDFPQLMLVPLFFGVIQFAYMIFATLALTGLTQGLSIENASNAVRGVVYFWLVLSLYWTLQVIANTCYVTVSGFVATWYFLYPNNMPKLPILGALRRAMINSLGSIAIGSLITALIQTARFFIQQAMRGQNEIVQCIVMCAINCLDSLVEYFNKYAYTEIAIYGKSYLNAAKDAWQLLKARGFEAVINDDLTGTLVSFLGLIGAAVTGLIVAGFGRFVIDNRNWGAWSGIGALIGGSIVYTAGHIIQGGVTTLFVCWAEDSEALQHTKPAIYERLRQALEVAYGVRSAHNAA